MQTMLIVDAELIAKFLRKNWAVAKWMAVWTETTIDANWSSLQDVRQDYPSADGVILPNGSVVVVFNVKGNTYRLLTKISYSLKTVWIVDILTHAQYDKNKWK